MSTRSRFVALAGVLAATLVLAGCGAATVEVTARTDPADTTATSAPAAADGGASDADAFCAAAADLANAPLASLRGLDLTGSEGSGPDLDAIEPERLQDELAGTMDALDAALADMARTAPPEIADDMALVASETTAWFGALGDASGLGEAITTLENLDTDAQALAEATQRVTAYTLEHCGFEVTGTARN